MKANDFRRIALGLDGVIERAHMGHPDFRVNGRIFATLHADMKFGMIKLTPDEQRMFVRNQPDVFSLEAGAWGRAGSTKVRLDVADDETVGEAMTLAWRSTVNATPARTTAKPARKNVKASKKKR